VGEYSGSPVERKSLQDFFLLVDINRNYGKSISLKLPKLIESHFKITGAINGTKQNPHFLQENRSEYRGQSPAALKY